MADELELNLRVVFTKDGTVVRFPDADSRQLFIDVAGTNVIRNRQSVGTTEEALVLGDVTVGGWLFAFNRDATNFVSIRQATGAGNMVQIKAGEWAAFRLSPSATAPFVIADTAAVELEYILLDL